MFGVADYQPLPPSQKAMIHLLEDGGFIPVHSDVPKVRPPFFYRVELVGGTEHRTGIMSFPVFALQVYAKDTATAETQSNLLLAFLKSRQFTSLGEVQYRAWSTVALPAPFPDPRVSDQRRWQLSGEFSLSRRHHI